VQALYAVSSGGILGAGLGQGMPLYIPEVHTDFVFAAVAEELGMLGAAAILLVYLIVVFRSLRIALRSPGPFEQFLALGLASLLGLQCIVIVAGNLELIPLTGITLPFVSYGGSSMLVNFVILGLLSRLSALAQWAGV
jgi:cell division protein FtsW (lipid II flippase)